MSKPPIDMRETWMLRVNTARIRMSIEHFDKVSAAYDKMRLLKKDYQRYQLQFSSNREL